MVKTDQIDPMGITQLTGVCRITHSSKSMVLRWLSGERPTRTPFPKPFKLSTRRNYWKVQEILDWIDAERFAAE
jgi:predicted DNA-binding transcriptional regulator AlpA